MTLIGQRLPGYLIIDGDKAAFLRGAPDADTWVTLRYALYTMGPELHILPSSLLDDWGNEIVGLKVYRWIRESGTRFPRAEVFGISPNGDAVQYFLRDMELFSRYPTYALAPTDDPHRAGILLDAVLVLNPAASSPQRIAVPDDVEEPLREARVSWWQVQGQPATLDFLRRGATDSG